MTCPKCETAAGIDIYRRHHWVVVCMSCYDADGDSQGYWSTSLVATGATREEAIDAWNDDVSDRLAELAEVAR